MTLGNTYNATLWWPAVSNAKLDFESGKNVTIIVDGAMNRLEYVTAG